MDLCKKVLILVLMEDTHWVLLDKPLSVGWGVLILVLMEDTHWVKGEYNYNELQQLS